MFPAVNHQQGDMRFFMHRLPDEVEAFASGRTYGFAGKRKYGISLPMLEKYRKAMSGRGWLSAKDHTTCHLCATSSKAITSGRTARAANTITGAMQKRVLTQSYPAADRLSDLSAGLLEPGGTN